MLFNSYPFLFAFLPITLLGFYLVARASNVLAAGWLAVASLVFYGWWNPWYVILLVASIACNFAVGLAILRRHGDPASRRLLAFGVTANLLHVATCDPAPRHLLLHLHANRFSC